MNEEKWLRAQVASNVVIAVFTVVMAVVGYYQWRITQIALTRSTQQGRPWVVLAELKTLSPLTMETPLTFSVTLRNVGQSPAFNATGVWGRSECDGPLSEECIDSCMLARIRVEEQERKIPYGIVGPQQERIEQLHFSTDNPADIAALHRGRKTLTFCGIVTFSDIFCIRYTRWYCLHYQGPRNDLGFCPGNLQYEEQMDECEG